MYWRHSDPELQARAARYLRRAAGAFAEPAPFRGDGAAEDFAAADFRAYLVQRAYQIARLVGSVEISGDSARIDPYPPGPQPTDRLLAARDLYAPIRAYARAAGLKAPLAESLETTAPASDVGALPVLAVVAIAVGAVVAIGLCANQAALVVDRYLERDEQTRRLAQLDAGAHQAIDRHLKREDDAGKTLPLDEATRRYLDQLGQAAAELAKAKAEAFPSVIDGNTARIPALGLAGGTLILAAAAAAFLFLNRK